MFVGGVPQALAGTLKGCPSEWALSKAMVKAKGATVDFGQACTITFDSPIKLGSTVKVTLDANGFDVVLAGDLETRLFVVTGATVAINGVTIEDGEELGTAGSNGTDGASGGAGGQWSGRGRRGRLERWSGRRWRARRERPRGCRGKASATRRQS